MATKSPERKIYDVLMKATKEGTVPFGYYGPETCRWATQEEMQRFGFKDFPLVHLDEKGDIDCYFTETEAVTIRPKNESKIAPIVFRDCQTHRSDCRGNEWAR